MPKPKLPERIGRLDELANNLWWSWHPRGRELFRTLDYPGWRLNGHNPVRQLNNLGPERLLRAAEDLRFLALYDEVISELDACMSPKQTWTAAEHPELLNEQIAYFSAEYAIHNSLPIYAGGLGILAGDLCKEACDLGLPLVAVGFMYPQGYFHQHIASDGWQQEIYRQLDFDHAPVNRVLSPEGYTSLAQVRLSDRTLHIGVWLVRLGRVEMYLLDTNIPENQPADRSLSARLYSPDREQRLQQEIVLGIGGVRVLRTLGLSPTIWHANEGHTSFMMLERIKEEVEENNRTFDEAVEIVRSTSVFTTHTPVPAGHDVFPADLIDKYFGGYWGSKLDGAKPMGLGYFDGAGSPGFNMTVLGLRTSQGRNGVSRLHGVVSRKMWNVLWPDLKEHDVPLQHITNGVHGPTWLAPEMAKLFARYLCDGSIEELVRRQDDPELWNGIHSIPDAELWAVHQLLKRKLSTVLHERIQERWSEGSITADQVLAMGALTHPEVLTIGFVRRFAEYKRPTLIFHDLQRLRSIVMNRVRPVQIVFAGKSHPADFGSKCLLQQTYNLARDQGFRGRVAFVEDYDMHLAHYLVHGVDVWLNTPRRLHEASGTSGMKAAINGVIHLSIPDGWWLEGYNGLNGWSVGGTTEVADPLEQDRNDANAIYSLLENEIVPLFYERDREGVPGKWIAIMKESIRSVAPVFCARRMMKEYIEKMYLTMAGFRREANPK